MQKYSEIWQKIYSELSKQYSETTMSLWFSEIKLFSFNEKVCIFLVPSELKRSCLEKNYTASVAGVIENLFGFSVHVMFVVDGQYYDVDPADELNSSSTAPTASISNITNSAMNSAAMVSTNIINEIDDEITQNMANSAETLGEISNQTGIHSTKYTFDNFIVGESNKFAAAACIAAAKNPAKSWNPVFIYGPSGLGKTHLLYAITNDISERYPNYKIMYVKGDDFTNQMIESISKNLTSQFRERYRKADILLIDDIQFIAGRESTQEEFFHTFNALFEDHKQIILTSDLPPKDIQKLEDRLRTRFEWGLIADIQPPNYELRIAIMKKKMQELGITIPNEVLVFLAEHLTSNVRQIEGAVKKISAYSQLNGDSITIPLATMCISDFLTNSGPIKISSSKIISTVATKYSVNPDDIYSKKKSATITKARQISIYLMRKMSDMSYPNIGKILNKDHSTIMYSFKQIEQEIQNNTMFEIEISELMKNIRGK